MFERDGELGQLFGHYLDSAATAQMLCAANDAMTHLDRGMRANVRRGGHRLGERTDELYEQARGTVARFLGTSAEQVVFTAGATAGLNMLAGSLCQCFGEGDEIVVTELEHHSNFVPWQQAALRTGAALKVWPVTSEGELNMLLLEQMITPRTRVVSVTQVSNVTGLVSDLTSIARRVRDVGALLVVDAAQAVPHGLMAEQADFLVFSGHKAFGPTGIGVLAARNGGLEGLQPVSFGGGMVAAVEQSGSTWVEMPWCLEPGTPPFSQALGLAAALDWLDRERAALEGVSRLTRLALDGLLSMPGVRVIGPHNRERMGIVSFTVDGVHPHDVAQVLDERGVWVRSGQMCAQPLMRALGLNAVVRASFAPYNTLADVAALLAGVDSSLALRG
ncbi:cysteine desulfurase [Pseudomonas sp. 5Ae-yellow]|nr:cysteine desulfurase [Pseudomonas sp. 5Ae-yellow]